MRAVNADGPFWDSKKLHGHEMSEQNEGNSSVLRANRTSATRLVAAGRDPVTGRRPDGGRQTGAMALAVACFVGLGPFAPLLTYDVAAAAETNDAAKLRAASLDTRFAALKTAASQSQADPIVAEIWALWLQSGNAEIDALISHAMTFMQVGRNTLSLAILDDVVKRAPDYAEGWNMRATLLYIMGEYDRSLADCEEVLKREPRHFGALAGMGMIGIAQGNDKAALAAYRRALAVNPYLKERELISALERKVEGQRL
jgi:tetratricopeptide (TPR) repeat protein